MLLNIYGIHHYMQKGYFGEKYVKRIVPIKDQQGNYLRLNANGSARDKRNHEIKHRFTIAKVVWGQQTTSKNKVITIERIIFHETGNHQSRFGYRTIGANGKFKDKWTWGESALMIPESDLRELLTYAVEKGVINSPLLN